MSCPPPYRRQVNYDSSQINYVVEGTPYYFIINKTNVTGNPATISTFTTAKAQAPIDMVIDSMSCVFFIDNPLNPGVGDCIPTCSVLIMIRDSLSRENWIATDYGILAQGTPIPLNLIFGRYAVQLPSPRPLYQNTLIEFDISPVGVAIIDFVLVMSGRRLDTLPPWEREMVCADPRTSGAYWVYVDPQDLVRADSVASPCEPGPVQQSFLRLPALPFDIMVTGMSGFVTDGADSAAPVARAWFDFNIIDANNSKMMAPSDSFIPSTLLSGSTMETNGLPDELGQVLQYVPRVTPLNVAWTMRQLSAFIFAARARFSPLAIGPNPTLTAQILLICFKVPTSEVSAGFPYLNRNGGPSGGSLRCPPGSDGQLPGYPGGPCPPYVNFQQSEYAMPGPGQNLPPQTMGPAPQHPDYSLGQAGMPPQAYRQDRGIWVNNAPGHWPGSMPYPPPALNTQTPIMIRNPQQEGGPLMMPNRGPGAQGWGIPGGPADGRGPRFKNTGSGQ